MSEPSFLVSRIEPDGLVIGSNGYTEIPLGAVFSSIAKTLVEGESPNFTTIELGEVAKVSLRLTEVLHFRNSIQSIPRGHSAGLRLEGNGIFVLAEVLNHKLAREFFHLRYVSEQV